MNEYIASFAFSQGQPVTLVQNEVRTKLATKEYNADAFLIIPRYLKLAQDAYFRPKRWATAYGMNYEISPLNPTISLTSVEETCW